mgnify:CR=1 FL=1
MTTLQDKTNTTGVQSPGNQIQFSRGGIAKKKYRRKSQISSNNENQTAGKTEGDFNRRRHSLTHQIYQEFDERQRRQEEKKEVEKKRVSMLPLRNETINNYNKIKENMNANLEKTKQIEGKSEKLHNSSKKFHELAKELTKK